MISAISQAAICKKCGLYQPQKPQDLKLPMPPVKAVPVIKSTLLTKG